MGKLPRAMNAIGFMLACVVVFMLVLSVYDMSQNGRYQAFNDGAYMIIIDTRSGEWLRVNPGRPESGYEETRGYGFDRVWTERVRKANATRQP
jgi:hypothetical protein